MKIDLTCPVELWQYAMPVQDASECTFVLNNLSSKVVTSILVTLSCFNKDNHLLFRQSERVQGFRAGVGERFSIMILPTLWRDVSGVDLAIEKVWFDDATIWRRGNAPLTSFVPNALPNGRALDELRFVAGPDAAGYPVVREQIWLCVCGRANPLDSTRCCRCERNRESVFASFNQTNVSIMITVHEQKLAELAREAREENSRLTEEEAKKQLRIKRKHHKLIKWCVTTTAVAAACAVTVIWILPAARYSSAKRLLETNRYEAARTAFAAMGAYGDADAQLLECDYGLALQLKEQGDEASLIKAKNAFSVLGDFRDSADQAQQTDYQLGQWYLEQKLFDRAMEVFQGLGDYQNSAEMCDRCIYLQAEELYQNDNESVAVALFMSIPHYQDAPTRVQACYYAMAQKELEKQSLEEAVRLFSLAGEYEDAPTRHDETLYLLAEAKLAADDLEEAGMNFLALKDYRDASARANDCLYQYAMLQMQAGDYESAAAVFERVPDYLDSQGQADVCRYQQAVALMGSGDYAAAVPLLERALGYNNTERLLNECYYSLAQAAIAQGDSATAERFLEQLGGYEDSAKLLRTVRYQAAETALSQMEYSEASTRYQLLGSYRDSADKLLQCQYQLARQAFDSGDYAQAIERFTALGSYQDSAEQLSNAYAAQVEAYTQAGDVDAALVMLPQVSGSQQATAKITELLLNEGARLESENKLADASQLYTQMGDVPAAQERVAAIQYRLAMEQKENGDIKGAGDVFLSLGDYEDAAQQAQLCYEALYSTQAAAARQAMEASDYPSVILALRDMDLTTLPAGYADLTELYHAACYEYAEQLYRDGEPYKAWPFYHAAQGYSDAASKLERRIYLILGKWQSSTGTLAEFRPDGTCELDGVQLYFRVSNFSVYTGATLETMALTHRLSSISETAMSLRSLSDSRDFKFVKTDAAAFPPMVLDEADDADIAATAAPVTEPPLAPTQSPSPSASPSVLTTPSASPKPSVSPAATQTVDEFQVMED